MSFSIENRLDSLARSLSSASNILRHRSICLFVCSTSLLLVWISLGRRQAARKKLAMLVKDILVFSLTRRRWSLSSGWSEKRLLPLLSYKWQATTTAVIVPVVVGPATGRCHYEQTHTSCADDTFRTGKTNTADNCSTLTSMDGLSNVRIGQAASYRQALRAGGPFLPGSYLSSCR